METDVHVGRSSVTLKTSTKGEIYFDIKYYWEEGDTPLNAVQKLKETYDLMNTHFPQNIVNKIHNK